MKPGQLFCQEWIHRNGSKPSGPCGARATFRVSGRFLLVERLVCGRHVGYWSLHGATIRDLADRGQ